MFKNNQLAAAALIAFGVASSSTSTVTAQTAATTRRQTSSVASSTQDLTATSADVAKARRAMTEITQAKLRADLTFIASDALEGRDTPSAGLDKAADFIAARLRKLGIKPAGDNNTYFQRIELRRAKLDDAATTATLNNQNLKYGEDFLTTLGSGEATGKLVFVGNGWQVKSKNIDDYQGLDVKDKIMIVAGGMRPAGVTRADLNGKAGEGTWSDPQTFARTHGARGIVLLQRGGEASRNWEARRAIAQRGFTTVKKFEDQNLVGALPTILLSDAQIQKLFADEGARGAAVISSLGTSAGTPAGFDLSSAKTMSFKVAQKNETVMTQNVVGILEGRDAKLKNEYLAIGAHYDHVGMNPNATGDKIFNGADDDGSGTVGVLSLAEAFAKAAPRRSVLFVWHAGEEKGLWGSRYFVENPTVPLASIVTQLNIDMIGRSRTSGDTDARNRNLTAPDEIYVIGSRMMSDSLAALSERVNESNLNLKFNYKYDDPSDTERLFYRSDHYNYATKGIPIIFYFDGVHADYHQPSDSVEKIDFAKMERVARTIFMTAAEIANAPERPRVDRPLPANLVR